jgi:hypothetical protein
MGAGSVTCAQPTTAHRLALTLSGATGTLSTMRKPTTCASLRQTEIAAAEGKDADEQREEEEEDEEKEAISTAQSIQAVVVKFCEKARVTQGFRWNEHREGLLHALIVEAGIDVHLLDMQARVKQYVASPLP